MRRAAALALLVAGVAVLAAGCGGKSGGKSSSDTTATADWANSLCGAFTSWTASVRSAGASLQGNVNEKSVKSAAEDMKSATDKLESDLKGLGKPDTDAGAKAKGTIDSLAGQLKTDVDKIDTAIKSVSGAKNVVPAVSTISTTLQTIGSQVRTAFNNLQQLDAKGDLEKAFKNAEQCKKLSNS